MGRSTAGRSGRERMPRVNELLREVLAENLERIADSDERIGLLTLTAVDCDPDLRHAKVLFDELSPEVMEALSERRVALQRALSREVRLRRTPQLSFAVDPVVESARRVEEALARARRSSSQPD